MSITTKTKVLPARQKAKKVLKNGNIVDKNSADSVWLIAVNQYTMMWTPKIKSLLPSLHKRSRLSRDLAKRGDLPARSRFGEGRGEIF